MIKEDPEMNRQKYDQEKEDLDDPAKPAWLPSPAENENEDG